MKLLTSVGGVIVAFTIMGIAGGQEKEKRRPSPDAVESDLQAKRDVYRKELQELVPGLHEIMEVDRARLKLESDLQEQFDVALGQLQHGSVEKRREAVLTLGRISATKHWRPWPGFTPGFTSGERAKAVGPGLAEGFQDAP